MRTIAPKELYEYFIETFDFFGTHILSKSDEEVEYLIFEEFDSNVISFLHYNSLDVLLKHNYIDNDIYKLCLQFREQSMKLINEKLWNVNEVKTNYQWLELMKFADLIKTKFCNFKK